MKVAVAAGDRNSQDCGAAVCAAVAQIDGDVMVLGRSFASR